jgi:hypothetical protein
VTYFNQISSLNCLYIILTYQHSFIDL